MEEAIIEAIKEEAKRLLPGHGCHGFEHTERVFETCIKIDVKEGADLSVLLPAALLHDIDRDQSNHARASAENSRRILMNANFNPKKVEDILEAISTHSFSGGVSPKTLEAKILSDADKLDAMGALGIYRAAMYSEEHRRPVEDFVAHFHEKLLKLQGMLFTGEAKRLAESRHGFMLEFLRQLERELNRET